MPNQYLHGKRLLNEDEDLISIMWKWHTRAKRGHAAYKKLPESFQLELPLDKLKTNWERYPQTKLAKLSLLTVHQQKTSIIHVSNANHILQICSREKDHYTEEENSYETVYKNYKSSKQTNWKWWKIPPENITAGDGKNLQLSHEKERAEKEAWATDNIRSNLEPSMSLPKKQLQCTTG